MGLSTISKSYIAFSNFCSADRLNSFPHTRMSLIVKEHLFYWENTYYLRPSIEIRKCAVWLQATVSRYNGSKSWSLQARSNCIGVVQELHKEPQCRDLGEHVTKTYKAAITAVHDVEKKHLPQIFYIFHHTCCFITKLTMFSERPDLFHLQHFV